MFWGSGKCFGRRGGDAQVICGNRHGESNCEYGMGGGGRRGSGTFKVEPRSLLYEVSVALNPTPPKSLTKIKGGGPLAKI